MNMEMVLVILVMSRVTAQSRTASDVHCDDGGDLIVVVIILW